MQFKNWLEERLASTSQALRLNKGERALYIGLQGTAKALYTWAIWRASAASKCVLIVHDLLTAEKYAQDLETWLPQQAIHVFRSPETVAQDLAIASPEALADRIMALEWLRDETSSGILIVPLFAMKKAVSSPSAWREAKLPIAVGDELAASTLAKQLQAMGYERVMTTMKPGEMSVRGDIVDVYPLNQENPLRFSLAFDEVEEIRSFDATSQKRIDNLEQVCLLPAKDFWLTPAVCEQVLAYVKKALSHQHVSEEQRVALEAELAALAVGEVTDKTMLFAQHLADKHQNLWAYLTSDIPLIIDDYPRLLEAEAHFEMDWAEHVLALHLPKDLHAYQPFSTALDHSKAAKHYFALLERGYHGMKFQVMHQLQTRPLPYFYEQLSALSMEMRAWLKQERLLIVAIDNLKTRQRLAERLREAAFSVVETDWADLKPGAINLLTGSFQQGVEVVDLGLVLLGEANIFQQVKRRRAPKRSQMSNAERIKSYTQLAKGDYVVHLNHGIGRFDGVETIEVAGNHKDYLTITYADAASIHVPVDQIDLIQKYVSAEGKAPRLNKMGGSEWARTKRKVSQQIEDIADDLLALYAERELQKAYAFGPDLPEQAEFEAAFPYVETEDQLRSLREIKRDMEKDKPMDRLLVGDVGFGKTEVAMRAAFKAATYGKQVAFLVPTTILAKQHYDTMVERFKDWPFEIGLLSRLRSGEEQAETIAGLKNGSVQIVIGTHRLLSKDIDFLDLGLVIVDEEQRFGVKAKERLKELRASVDILTLTATPIPRTLHMSILGARALSVIETPPANRYPVQTYVLALSPATVRDAIRRELARSGQVFYLFNNIKQIEMKALAIEGLVPEARIAIAHGQMTPRQLETVMMDFISGEYDVLLTTTIIETGVDIPNVNTLMVERADWMGLSTLYQLRGRVGRSSRIAYAYFMYQPDRVLSEAGEKRLAALRDFTELGSGFKIAMSDLSIRGAGNLLGREQHGFVNSIGFDLYTKMLEDTIRKKRGEVVEDPESAVEINLAIDAYLPSDYIPDEGQKLEIYKRIKQLPDSEAMWDLDDELLDRFGEPPLSVQWLLWIGAIRAACQHIGIEKIQQDHATFRLTFNHRNQQKAIAPKIFEALADLPFKVGLKADAAFNLVLSLTTDKRDVSAWLDDLLTFTERLKALLARPVA